MSSVAMIGIPEELLSQTAATGVENNTKTKLTKSYKQRSSNGGGGVLQEIQPHLAASSVQMMAKDKRSYTTSSPYTSTFFHRAQDEIDKLVIIEGNIGMSSYTRSIYSKLWSTYEYLIVSMLLYESVYFLVDHEQIVLILIADSSL